MLFWSHCSEFSKLPGSTVSTCERIAWTTPLLKSKSSNYIWCRENSSNSVLVAHICTRNKCDVGWCTMRRTLVGAANQPHGTARTDPVRANRQYVWSADTKPLQRQPVSSTLIHHTDLITDCHVVSNYVISSLIIIFMFKVLCYVS